MSIILIIGIPGAGKTTLCKEIQQIARRSSENCRIFSFDDLLSSIDWSETARSSRKTWEESVKDEIQKLADPKNPENASIFVLDDIFYLASMRRPFERFARRVGLAYFVVHLNTKLEEALKRNKMRDQKAQIPDENIHNVHDRLEIPLEAHVFTDPKPREVEAFVRNVLSTPRPKPQPMETEKTEYDGLPVSKRTRLDTDLRKIVSKMMQSEANRKNAKRINERRREFYEKLKEDGIEFWTFDELYRDFCDFV